MIWLDDATERWGPPRIAPPVAGEIDARTGKPRTFDGVLLKGDGGSRYIRRGWVWFPANVNHSLRIDDHGEWVELTVSRHQLPSKLPSVQHVELVVHKRRNGTVEVPTIEQIGHAIDLVWGSFDTKWCDLCAIEGLSQCKGIGIHCMLRQHCDTTSAVCSADLANDDHADECCDCGGWRP